MTNRFSRRTAIVALAALTVAAGTGPALAEYPEKPVTLIVPSGAGGSHDLTGRAFTSVLPNYLGQPVIVKLVPGSAGQVGSAEAARAPADGYTLLYSADSIDQIPKHVVDLPYDPDADFTTVAQLSTQTLAVIVRADSPYKTFQDLLDAAKAKPGEIRFAHSGVWGPIFVVGGGLFGLEGLDINYIGYQGGGPSMQALLSGDADFTIQATEVIEGQGDRIRVLASAGPERTWDDVPTLAEFGYPESLGIFRRVVFVQRDTPPEVVAKLREAFAALQEDKTYQRLVSRLGTNTDYIDGAEYEPMRLEQGAYFKTIVDRMTGKAK